MKALYNALLPNIKLLFTLKLNFQSKKEKSNMKLVSFNIGIKIDNNEKITGFLKENNCDIVGLQESIRHLNDTVFKQYQSATFIEKSLAKTHPHTFFAPLWLSDKFIKNGEIHREFGGKIEQGNHIISKFPIVSAQSLFYYENYSLIRDISRFYEIDHSRNVCSMTLDINGKLLKVLNLHGIWNKTRLGDERTMHQCKFALNEALKDGLPTIIIGDFNLSPESESIKLFDKHFRNLTRESNVKTTRSKDREPSVVDYIFTNDKIKVNSFKVIDTDISDHLPLILDFDV